MKIVTYINTLNTNSYKLFILKPFNINYLYPFNGEDLVMFNGWKGRSMNNLWYSLSNDDDVIIEYYPSHYIVKHNNTTYKLPIPITINDFINDMDRCNVDLYWNKDILTNLQPKDYLSDKEIIRYYEKSLLKIDKSHELNI